MRKGLAVKEHTHDTKPLAVFDIDGTLFRSAVMIEIVDRMIAVKMIPESAYADLVAAKNAWKDRQGSFEEYNEQLVRVIERHFTGINEREFNHFAEAVIGELKNRQYRFTHELLERLQQKGYVLMAVSGMLQGALKKYNRFLKFDYVFGWEQEVKGGKFTGKPAGLHPMDGKEKVVKYFLAEHAEVTLDGSVGIGDTEGDIGFLEMIENPIAFNPNQRLLTKAKEAGWRVVLERKDVVYDLSEPRIIGSPDDVL
ncbi:MAG: HAD-IB family phosphatase [bacterium]|nr:HAD-IB family phosphatase [bacterium]MDZ4248043.1 HAD-IB family phosphatase [Patescibacteria group bacterium]